MKHTIPVVIFGDYISAYGVIKALSQFNIPLYMVSSEGKGLALKSRYIKKSIILKPDESSLMKNLNSWIQQEIGEEAVFIVAGDDRYLQIISKKYKELTGQIHLTFPDWNIVQLVRKKTLTYRVAADLGIPVPATYMIHSKEELQKLVDEKGDSLHFPLFMKAEQSERLLTAFGVKGIISHNTEELFYNYLAYDCFFGELILQELIQSKKEIIKTVLISLNKNSDPTGFIVNQKKRSSGKYLGGTFVVSDWSEEILNYSLKLVKKIGYYGYASVQYKYDSADDTFKFLEINGRISMSNSIALACGVNLPYLMYREAIGDTVPVLKSFKKNYPDRVIWWFLIKDIIAYIKYNRHIISLHEYISSLFGKRYVLEPFYHLDPLPGIWYIFDILKRIFLKILKK